MKANAILVKPEGIEKVYVDLSNYRNICQAINANGISTIHTIKTQEISRKLGIHLVGYVDRYGGNLDNELAAQISGYDEIYSFMLLCKTDDKWNDFPLSEGELECLYTYLTTGKVTMIDRDDKATAFFEKYGIDNPALPKVSFKPEVYQLDSVPYVMLFRYDMYKLNDKQIQELGNAMFYMADRLINEGFNIVDGVHLSPDKKYYIQSKMDQESGAFNVLIQAKEEVDEVLIKDVTGCANGILGKPKEYEHVDLDTAPEEADD